MQGNTTPIINSQTAEDTETPVTPAVPVDKSELKSLLHEVVSDIQADKTGQEGIEKLIQEFQTAKNDFIGLGIRIAEEIEKYNKNKKG